MTFAAWKGRVNAIVEGRAGLSVDDLPDFDFMDYFDGEMTPSECATDLLEENGFDDFDFD